MPSPSNRPIEEALAERSFAFFPPIRGIEFNEWQFRKATWSEILVANPRGGIEVWIPRRHFGKVSSVDEPIPIAGLELELEYRAGTVFPFRPKLLEMPREILDRAAEEKAGSGSSPRVLHMGRGHRNEGSVLKLIGVAVAVALVLVFTTVVIYRGGGIFPRQALMTTNDQDYLALSGEDDYNAVVRRLGQPSEDRKSPKSKEVVFRALEYKSRAYTVILFGADEGTVRYIGTMDANWRPIHSVAGRGTDFSAMLRGLSRF